MNQKTTDELPDGFEQREVAALGPIGDMFRNNKIIPPHVRADLEAREKREQQEREKKRPAGVTIPTTKNTNLKIKTGLV